MKVRERMPILDAIQWNKPGDHPAVYKDRGVFKVDCRSYQVPFVVNPGDWLIIDGNRVEYVCSNERLLLDYQIVYHEDLEALKEWSLWKEQGKRIVTPEEQREIRESIQRELGDYEPSDDY